MYKWRQRSLPPQPDSLTSYANIVNSNAWRHLKNYQGGGTLNISSIVGPDSDTSVVFVDLEFAQKVCGNCHAFIDATYDVTPVVNDIAQFLTFLAEKYNHVRNCLFFL